MFVRPLPRLVQAAVRASLVLAAACSAPQQGPLPLSERLAAGNDVWRTHFIDVGQSLAVLLEFPCAAVLVDTGAESNPQFDGVARLRDYLDDFFDRRADLNRTFALVVVTHPHIDHTLGLPLVLERYRVLNIIDNGMTHGSGARQQVAMLERVAHPPEGSPAIGRRSISVGDIVDPAGLTDAIIDPVRCPTIDPGIKVLWGRVGEDPGWGGNRFGRTNFQNANNHSIVLRVDYGKASALLPGDIEPPAIAALLARSQATGALDVDIYQVAHHGSSNGTTPGLVAAMTPAISVFGAGEEKRHIAWSAWQYGHPRLEIVAMLAGATSRRRRTIEVPVAVGSHNFVAHQVDRALYASGWDGHVVVEAHADGGVRVVFEGRSDRGATSWPLPQPMPAPHH